MDGNVLAILSLIFLVVAIALGFIKKINVGLIAMGFALIIGKVAGLNDKAIFSGFSVSLFITLAGTMYLFAIAQANGTLELLAKKIVALAGNKTALIPVFMFLFGFVVSAMGPGPIPTHALAATFGISLALQMDNCNPLFIPIMGQIGAMAGCTSPLSPTGIIGINLAAEAGITDGVLMPMFLSTAVCFTIFAIIVYFFVFKGHRLSGENPLKLKELPKFSKEQMITIMGMIAMAVIVLAKGYNVGLVAFLIAIILNFLKIGDEKEAFKLMPWGTILMCCCIGVLMSIVIDLGGINLIVTALTSVMTEFTSPMIFGAASGVMSWFSSTSGVVMPTMIPTIPNIVDAIGGSAVQLIIACVVVANCAGYSPASSAGGVLLSAYTSQANLNKEDVNKTFMKLFGFSIFGVVCTAIMGILGLFRLFL